MLNFLLDIAPDKSQLLLTIKLAGILREKKQEVYYTYTSNPAFTPVLYDKGISNCVLYPDDFRWLKPDLTLLYNPQIEMFAHFKTKSSFHKTKGII